MFQRTAHPRSIPTAATLGPSFVLPARPHDVGPVFDPLSAVEALATYDHDVVKDVYPPPHKDGISPEPPKPEAFSDPYLYPILTAEERKRLTMLWYHTRDLEGDQALLNRLQDKIDLLKSLIGWEFAICGLLENDFFKRVVTAGLPLAILPRRESTCSHTIQQANGTIFFVPDMSTDWRFEASPHVKIGGLRSYAGTPLRCSAEDESEVSLGTLCIASNTAGLVLNEANRKILIKFAELIAEDIMNASRVRRAEQQRLTDNMLREVATKLQHADSESSIIALVEKVFPNTTVCVMPVKNNSVQPCQDGLRIDTSTSQCGVWEDEKYIDELIRTKNHQKLKADRPVRALVGKIRAPFSETALVVTTEDIACIYDDVDVRFIESCASLLSIAAQEQSFQEALSSRENFMRGLTHRLRTPIHGILGAADLLEDELRRLSTILKEPSDGNVKETLTIIRNSGRQLMSTVNNVIKFNRWADTVNHPNTVAPNDLNQLEADLLEDVISSLPEGHLENVSIFFDNRLPQGVDSVTIDQVSLRDCLQSLVMNAAQNTSHGSVVITISAADDYSSIVFDVEDTGHGIPAEDQPSIFDTYLSTDHITKGIGLGLTLARRLAETLNGTVQLVSSEVGTGSHFRAEFKAPGFSCSLTQPKVLDRNADEAAKQYRIVLPDSHCATTKHFVRFLEGRGYIEDIDGGCPLVIVPISDPLEETQLKLDAAGRECTIVPVVLTGSNISAIQVKHVGLLAFNGPFTSFRLKHILSEIGQALGRSRESKISNGTNGVNSDDFGVPTPLETPPALTALAPPPLRLRGSIRDCAPHCLLVDDNAINLRILQLFCDKRNFSSDLASDGFGALDAYKAAAREQNGFSLVLLDLQMPNCDGVEACKEIRAFEEQEHLQPALIFIITGQDSPSDRAKTSAAGADRFFVKPLAPKSLDQAISQYFKTNKPSKAP